jgi:hypothetical protein
MRLFVWNGRFAQTVFHDGRAASSNNQNAYTSRTNGHFTSFDSEKLGFDNKQFATVCCGI